MQNDWIWNYCMTKPRKYWNFLYLIFKWTIKYSFDIISETCRNGLKQKIGLQLYYVILFFLNWYKWWVHVSLLVRKKLDFNFTNKNHVNFFFSFFIIFWHKWWLYFQCKNITPKKSHTKTKGALSCTTKSNKQTYNITMLVKDRSYG